LDRRGGACSAVRACAGGGRARPQRRGHVRSAPVHPVPVSLMDRVGAGWRMQLVRGRGGRKSTRRCGDVGAAAADRVVGPRALSLCAARPAAAVRPTPTTTNSNNNAQTYICMLKKTQTQTHTRSPPLTLAPIVITMTAGTGPLAYACLTLVLQSGPCGGAGGAGSACGGVAGGARRGERSVVTKSGHAQRDRAGGHAGRSPAGPPHTACA
jgi:hypothetical protein